jgi:hypothetical protein
MADETWPGIEVCQGCREAGARFDTGAGVWAAELLAFLQPRQSMVQAREPMTVTVPIPTKKNVLPLLLFPVPEKR